MIFQHTIDLVLEQKKTQTRRIMSDRDSAKRDEKGQIVEVLHNGRVKWRVGQTYAIQPGRNKPEVARMKITTIRSENAQEISLNDAKAEGYQSRDEFLAMWQKIHGADKVSARVWVISFELIT